MRAARRVGRSERRDRERTELKEGGDGRRREGMVEGGAGRAEG